MLGGVTQGRDEGVEDIDVELEASRRFREEKVNALSFLDGVYAPFASHVWNKSSGYEHV